MKSFYTQSIDQALVPHIATGVSGVSMAVPVPLLRVPTRARVAVYEAAGAAPRVEDIAPAPVAEFIEAISARVYQLTREAGGHLPYTVVRELAENLIHADFAEPVISILESGSVVRFADQGPGISNVDRALLPGFTTARGEMKAFIRGVGSGLPIVRDFLSLSGGSLLIEDNLGAGAVVTVCAGSPSGPLRAGGQAFNMSSLPSSSSSSPPEEVLPPPTSSAPPLSIRLSTRQKQVLALVLESGAAGPSLVAKELGVAVSTAYRDLASLEEVGLISAESGKRAVTELGLCFLDELMAR